MHPDEDWAETFAVWMTPGYDWRAAYADWPGALAKLEYCDRTMPVLNTRDPEVTATERDEDVSELTASIEQFYRTEGSGEDEKFSPAWMGPCKRSSRVPGHSKTLRRPLACPPAI